MTAISPRCFRADPRADGAASFPWWLAYCRVNQEMGLADRLRAADVPHLLPVARYERVHPSGKRRTTDRPLFPGYLFLTGEGLAYAKPSTLRGLVSASPVADVPHLVTELSRLCDLLDSGAPMGEARPIQPGDRVRIASGVYAGFTGTMIRESGRDMLLIEIVALGRSVPFAVESWQVERVEGEGR